VCFLFSLVLQGGTPIVCLGIGVWLFERGEAVTKLAIQCNS
jgi:hypothetical protein